MSAREDYAKLHANTSGPHHQGQTSSEAQAALDEIDALRAVETVADRVRSIADTADRPEVYRLLHETADELDALLAPHGDHRAVKDGAK